MEEQNKNKSTAKEITELVLKKPVTSVFIVAVLGTTAAKIIKAVKK